MTTLKTTVRNGRIDVAAPSGIPEGTEVILMIGTSTSTSDTETISPEEIARVLAAMRNLKPLEIPTDVAADLDAWERQVNQHGIDHTDKGIYLPG